MISPLTTPRHQSNENKGKVIISKGQIYPAYKWLNIELHQNNLVVPEQKMLELGREVFQSRPQAAKVHFDLEVACNIIWSQLD